MREVERNVLLAVTAGGHRVGIPLASVRETMRPLPIEALRAAPPFVLGVAIIRAASVPVVDLGALLGQSGASAEFHRFVTLDVDGRSVALAVDAVDGVLRLEASALAGLPPLLAHAAGESIEALALHDDSLLFVLRDTRMIPASAGGASEAHP